MFLKHHAMRLLLVDGDGAYCATGIRVELSGDLHGLSRSLTAGHSSHSELTAGSDRKGLAHLVRDHLVCLQAEDLGLADQQVTPAIWIVCTAHRGEFSSLDLSESHVCVIETTRYAEYPTSVRTTLDYPDLLAPRKLKITRGLTVSRYNSVTNGNGRDDSDPRLSELRGTLSGLGRQVADIRPLQRTRPYRARPSLT